MSFVVYILSMMCP